MKAAQVKHLSVVLNNLEGDQRIPDLTEGTEGTEKKLPDLIRNVLRGHIRNAKVDERGQSLRVKEVQSGHQENPDCTVSIARNVQNVLQIDMRMMNRVL